MEKIKIVALGGLDEEGKDLYCIELNDSIFVIGAGFKYPTKMTPGIDFIIADFSYLKENKERVRAYILPKSKENSFGALPYIYKEVKAPIYCTQLTKLYLEDFSRKYHQENEYDFVIMTLPKSIKIESFKFDFFSTCASVPQTFGFSIETKFGNIVYSSDFIVEYSNDYYFKLDLNTLGKIAEKPTLLLLSESINCDKPGYCSPDHRLYPHLVEYFKKANGRIFIAAMSDNLYRIDEIYRACKEFNKKIAFYDQESKDIYELKKFGKNDFFKAKNIVETEDVLRTKASDLVILMSDTNEKIYEKIEALCAGENEIKQIKLTPQDTFILGFVPSDRHEIIAVNVIDDLYKSGCEVKYVNKKSLAKMHAYEEDIKMLLSLLKPKYYFPIEGYYVNLLNNAKIAFNMSLGLSHNNIFLLDNGQSLIIEDGVARCDFNANNEINVGDVMIDGIGVGDVVHEIINDRTRLGEDGVIVFGCAISKTTRQLIAGPDVQMRGFLYLKDAETVLKEVTKLFVETTESWLIRTSTFSTEECENKLIDVISRYLQKSIKRNPVIRPQVILLD